MLTGLALRLLARAAQRRGRAAARARAAAEAGAAAVSRGRRGARARRQRARRARRGALHEARAARAGHGLARRGGRGRVRVRRECAHAADRRCVAACSSRCSRCGWRAGGSSGTARGSCSRASCRQSRARAQVAASGGAADSPTTSALASAALASSRRALLLAVALPFLAKGAGRVFRRGRAAAHRRAGARAVVAASGWPARRADWKASRSSARATPRGGAGAAWRRSRCWPAACSWSWPWIPFAKRRRAKATRAIRAPAALRSSAESALPIYEDLNSAKGPRGLRAERGDDARRARGADARARWRRRELPESQPRAAAAAAGGEAGGTGDRTRFGFRRRSELGSAWERSTHVNCNFRRSEFPASSMPTRCSGRCRRRSATRSSIATTAGSRSACASWRRSSARCCRATCSSTRARSCSASRTPAATAISSSTAPRRKSRPCASISRAARGSRARGRHRRRSGSRNSTRSRTPTSRSSRRSAGSGCCSARRGWRSSSRAMCSNGGASSGCSKRSASGRGNCASSSLRSIAGSSSPRCSSARRARSWRCGRISRRKPAASRRARSACCWRRSRSAAFSGPGWRRGSPCAAPVSRPARGVRVAQKFLASIWRDACASAGKLLPLVRQCHPRSLPTSTTPCSSSAPWRLRPARLAPAAVAAGSRAAALHLGSRSCWCWPVVGGRCSGWASAKPGRSRSWSARTRPPTRGSWRGWATPALTPKTPRTDPLYRQLLRVTDEWLADNARRARYLYHAPAARWTPRVRARQRHGLRPRRQNQRTRARAPRLARNTRKPIRHSTARSTARRILISNPSPIAGAHGSERGRRSATLRARSKRWWAWITTRANGSRRSRSAAGSDRATRARPGHHRRCRRAPSACCAADLAARVRVEEQLRRANERWNLIIEQMPLAFIESEFEGGNHRLEPRSGAHIRLHRQRRRAWGGQGSSSSCRRSMRQRDSKRVWKPRPAQDRRACTA